MSSYKPILLIEDNRADEELTLIAFKRLKILNEVVVVRDGVAGIDYLFGKGRYLGRDTSQLPTLILLDLKLPMVDGLEVLKVLRAQPLTKLIPIVIFTASDDETDRLRSYNLGANGYVNKAFKPNDFVEVIRKIGLFWLDINETSSGAAKTPQHAISSLAF